MEANTTFFIVEDDKRGIDSVIGLLDTFSETTLFIARTRDEALELLPKIFELPSRDIVTVLDGEIPISKGLLPYPWYAEILEKYQKCMGSSQSREDRRHFFIPNAGNNDHNTRIIEKIQDIPQETFLLSEGGKPKGFAEGIQNYKCNYTKQF